MPVLTSTEDPERLLKDRHDLWVQPFYGTLVRVLKAITTRDATALPSNILEPTAEGHCILKWDQGISLILTRNDCDMVYRDEMALSPRASRAPVFQSWSFAHRHERRVKIADIADVLCSLVDLVKKKSPRAPG